MDEDLVLSDSGSINADRNEDENSLFSRSPSVEETSDESRWRASEPPQEVFGDGEWKFQIIGEEVDYEGNIQYEVEWEDWEREDHSNVTWETKHTIDDTKWRPVQQRIRNNLASKSLSVDIITTTDIHNTDTYLRNQAFEEKLKRYKNQTLTNPFEEMEQLMQKHREYLNPSTSTQMEMSQSSTQGSSTSPFPLRMNQRASTRQQTEQSLAGTSRSTSSRASSRFSSVTASVPPRPFSSFSATSSTTQLPVNSSVSQRHQSSSSSRVSTASLKGKEKEVLRPYKTITVDHWDPTHLRREASSSLSELSSSPVIKDSQILKKPKRGSRQSDSDDSMSILALGRTPKKRVRRIINSGSEDDGRPISPSMFADFQADSSSNPKLLDRREVLQQSWTQHAQDADAAPIYIVNDVDEDDVPDIDGSFCYLESIYEFSPDVEKPPDDFLIFCSCRRCNKATLCDCQQPSDLVDEKGVPFFAYQSGLFTFNVLRGIEVIECNKFCGCSNDPRNCPNRVSQKPRRHPIEIFKTQKCGWGVRSTQPVKRGQVLGLYTGLVITREHANSLPEHHAQYRFDLDGDEAGDQEVELNHPRYSVDSWLHGNWTRFINHSCSPNLQIYLVVHDTPPGVGLPYIVFVANQHIPVRKEFTFDYNPSKPMTSSQDTERGEPCHCGAENCRGYY